MLRSRTGCILNALGIFLLSLTLAVSLSLISALSDDTNGVDNPGFEDKSGGRWTFHPSSRCLITDEVSHTGKHSLSIVCNKESDFATARQTVSISDQGTFNFSVWIKLSELKGLGTYFSLSWQDAQGKVIDRYYSSPVVGTLEWTKIEVKQRVPDGAKALMIGLHTNPKCSGTVWYDDIQIDIKNELEMRSLIIYPNYRSQIYHGQKKQVIIGVDITETTDHPLSSLGLSVQVLSKDGRTISEARKDKLNEADWQSISLDLKEASPGDYQAVVRLIDNNSKQELKFQKLNFSILGQNAPLPAVYFDEHNRCIVNGKLFFPLGYYTWGVDVKDLDCVADTNFNCIIHYNLFSQCKIPEAIRYLDEVNSRGLKFIASTNRCYDNFTSDPIIFDSWQGPKQVLQGAVKTLKDHPALLAWYTNDERSDFFIPQLEQAYNYIKTADPDHPTYQVLTRKQPVVYHVGSTDALGTDCYPVYEFYTREQSKIELEDVVEATELVRNAVMGARPVWEVIECCKIASDGRPPTFEEMLCESYLAIAHGARGLFFFCLPYAQRDGDVQMQRLKDLGEEMEKVRPVALGTDIGPEDSLKTTDKRISVLTRSTPYGIFAIAVNPSSDKIKAEFQIRNVSSVEVHTPKSPSCRISVSNNSFTDEIEPMGTRLYKLSQ